MADQPPTRSRHVRRWALIGAALAIACHLLPPEHREICKAIANVCTGGVL